MNLNLKTTLTLDRLSMKLLNHLRGRVSGRIYTKNKAHIHTQSHQLMKMIQDTDLISQDSIWTRKITYNIELSTRICR
jgi:hypothetical protein